MALPGNHLLAIFTLPEGDTRYPARWGWIKAEFTKTYLAVRTRLNMGAWICSGLALFNLSSLG
jgi:hypothetical protein